MEKAHTPSIIEHFRIEDLFGYRTLAFDSPHAASVLIAQNGAGKTTLMSALNSVLSRHFGKLRFLEFSRIALKIRGYPEIVIPSEAFKDLGQSGSEFLRSTASELGVEPNRLLTFLLDEWADVEEEDFIENQFINSIIGKLGYNTRVIKKRINEIRDIFLSENESLAELHSTLDEALSNYEIVYLPTYRRLELSLAEDDPRRRQRKRSHLQFNEQSIHSGKVEFGLSDIRDQLRRLNNAISSRSNTGYRDLTARILNDLLESRLDQQALQSGRKPERDDLEIFFDRLSDSRRMGPYPQMTIPEIDRLYSTEMSESRSNFFLNYFMDQLTDVVEATKDIEQSVDSFISTCNKYLMREDQSTVPFEARGQMSKIDAKKLNLNRSTLAVTAESVPTGRRIGLDELSSGEKQMISLFAKMYLYPKDKIVLIDEPELSLSIDWQSELLPDILSSPNCEQLIAITHSPFVFDNSLEPFARSLDISVDYTKIAQDDADLFEMD